MRHLLAAFLLVFAGAVPAAAETGHVDLVMVAGFDKAAYLPTDVVRMYVKVANAGTATATGVVVRSAGDLEFAPWGDLDESGPGIELAPGEEVSFEVTATPNDTGDGMTQRVAAVSAQQDANPADNEVTAEGFVTAEKCDLTLRLYRDVDRDEVVDPGEPQVGVLVRMFGGLVPRPLEARTDANGVIRFRGMEGGEYGVTVDLPDSWSVEVDPVIRIRPGHNELTIRATHHDLSKLVATVSLDRPSYAPGAPVRERITLTNNDAGDFTGVRALCGGGMSLQSEFLLSSEGWGELSGTGGGPGVVLRAGETRTWEFTDVVPIRAWYYGFVALECEFWVGDVLTPVFAGTSAMVPGGRGTVGGTLVSGDKPVPDVKLLLVNRLDGTIVARAVTDAAGAFRFPEVPADLYELRLVGPWRWEAAQMRVHVIAGEYTEVPTLTVVPGSGQRDPDSPVSPASTADHPVVLPVLADTGADVAALTALGALLVVAGALLVRTRRRA